MEKANPLFSKTAVTFEKLHLLPIESASKHMYRSQARRPSRKEEVWGVGLAPLLRKTETATQTANHIHTLTWYDADDSADEAVMMRLDDNHQEVQPRISMLSVKTTTKIATWNVRTLYQTIKQANWPKSSKNLKIIALLYLELLKCDGQEVGR